jgi:ABC-type transporter Mla MlaB component
MIDCAKEERGDGEVLRLSGDLMIQDAAELRSALIDVFAETGTIDVDVSSVGQMDVSCLQLLCASHKKAIESNKMFRISDEWSGAFEQSVKEACFLRHTGCFLDAKKECLWVKE